MSIIRLIVMAVILVLLMPYITNLLSLIGIVLPTTIVNILSLAIIIGIIRWVTKE